MYTCVVIVPVVLARDAAVAHAVIQVPIEAPREAGHGAVGARHVQGRAHVHTIHKVLLECCWRHLVLPRLLRILLILEAAEERARVRVAQPEAVAHAVNSLKERMIKAVWPLDLDRRTELGGACKHHEGRRAVLRNELDDDVETERADKEAVEILKSGDGHGARAGQRRVQHRLGRLAAGVEA